MPIARHIVVLLDGTNCAATRGLRRDLTNLFYVGAALQNQKLDPQTRKVTGEQLILYFPGPGVRSSVLAPIELAFGHGLNDTIMEAYLSIANNFRDPSIDRIYIFGYSRGAVAAKGLAALISKAGLVRRDHLHRFKKAWSYYRGIDSAQLFVTDEVVHRVRIAFVGLFDPVLGPPTSVLDVQYSKTVDECIDYALEIVAYDECRLAFSEQLWRVEDLAEVGDVYARPLRAPRLNLQQIWLPGAHGDVGGQQGDKLLSAIALLSMLERIQARAGLTLNEKFVEAQLSKLMGVDQINITSPWKYNFGGVRSVIGTRRKVPRSSETFLHPLIGLLQGNDIRTANRRRTYQFHDGDILDYNKYDFNLSGILPGPDRASEINSHIHDILSQI